VGVEWAAHVAPERQNALGALAAVRPTGQAVPSLPPLGSLAFLRVQPDIAG
jgi:hypothetical protein